MLKLSFNANLLIKIIKIIGAFSIFLLSINIYAITTSHIFENIIVEKFALDKLENVVVGFPSYQTLLHSSILKHVTIVIGISIFLFFSIIIGGFKLKISSLTALIFSSFWVLILLLMVQLYLTLSLPPIQYNVIYVELGNVSFYDAYFRGIDDQNNFIEISSPIVYADNVKVYRAYGNGTLPKLFRTDYVPQEQFHDFLQMTKTFFNASGISYYENEELMRLKFLHITSIDFKEMRYDQILSLRDVRTSEPTYIEGLMIVTSLIAPVLMASYIAFGFKVIYSCSRKFAVGVGLIILLILQVIAMFMGVI
ncbi:MAG: hypothetical protein NDP13_06510 [Crenarchaeota archaeon]|nr:hypothetical protein [Thermoproteota archaeon]